MFALPLRPHPTNRTVQEQCCVAVMEDSMCTDGINTAKDLRSCDTLFSNTCETKTKKVPFCLMLSHVLELVVPRVCWERHCEVTVWTENLIQLTHLAWCHCVSQPVWGQMIDERERMTRMRHATPGRTGSFCCQREINPAVTLWTVCRLASKHLSLLTWVFVSVSVGSVSFHMAQPVATPHWWILGSQWS